MTSLSKRIVFSENHEYDNDVLSVRGRAWLGVTVAET